MMLTSSRGLNAPYGARCFLTNFLAEPATDLDRES